MTTTETEQLQIDWASAEIDNGNLTVQLEGDAPKGWGRRFEGVLALLRQNADEWGEISLSKRTIHVADVKQGAEAEVRHLLESVLLQVNSDLVEDSDAPASPGDEDPQQRSDRAMAERFRGFAEHEESEHEE